MGVCYIKCETRLFDWSIRPATVNIQTHNFLAVETITTIMTSMSKEPATDNPIVTVSTGCGAAVPCSLVVDSSNSSERERIIIRRGIYLLESFCYYEVEYVVFRNILGGITAVADAMTTREWLRK